MRLIHLAGLTTLAVLSSAMLASAADLRRAPAPVYVPPPPPPAVYNWTGLYVGINGGGGWGGTDWLVTSADDTFWPDSPGGDTGSLDSNGWLAGGQIGANWQNGPWVFGAELSGDGGDIKGSATSTYGADDDVYTTRIQALVLASAKIGFAAGNWMIYGKGGYAGASVKSSVSDTTAPLTGSGADTTWHSGYNLGVGAEVGLMANVSLGLQYDFVHLSTVNADLGDATAPNFVDISPKDTHIVTVRLNWRM